MKTATRSLLVANLVLCATALSFAQEPAPAPAPPAPPAATPSPEPAPPLPKTEPTPSPVKPEPVSPSPKPSKANEPKPEKVETHGEGTDAARSKKLQVPQRLDDLIEQAQESSPDIRIAEAELREAQARLRQAQLEVTQQITKLYEDLQPQREQLSELMKQLTEAGKPISDEARVKLNETEAALSKKLAELNALMGGSYKSAFKSTPPVSTAGLATHPRPKLEEMPQTELKKSLETPMSVEFEDQTLPVISDYLSDYFSVNIVIDPTVSEVKIPYIRLNNLSLKEGLLAIADLMGNAAFIIRPSYIFATTRENAQTINAPCIPDYLPLYVTPEVATQLKKQEPSVSPLVGSATETTENFTVR